MRAMKVISLFFCCVISGFVFCGCPAIDETIEFITPQGEPGDAVIRMGYDKTELKVSNAAEVLSVIHLKEHELLSQSKSTIALQGIKKRKHKMWVKMVAFNEDTLTVQRKYLFLEDERPKFFFTDPVEGARFECEVVADKELLSKPYANENARRIAVLKQVLADFQKDIVEVEGDNKMLKSCGMMINQALGAVVTQLEDKTGSPALAARLEEPKGVEFSHLSYGKGKAGMMIECNEIVKVKIMLGNFIRFFEKEPFERRECH